MQRFATGPVIVALAVFAVWTAIGATRVSFAVGDDDTGAFWAKIAVLYVLAAAAAWFAFRLYRIRQAKRRQPLTNR